MKKRIFLVLVLTITVFTMTFLCVKVNASQVEVNLLADEVTQSENVVKNWIDKIFTPERVAMYMSWVAYIGTIIGLVVNISRLKKDKNLTASDVKKEIEKGMTEQINNAVEGQIVKYFPKLVSSSEKTIEIMSIFAKILALSQENTPENRIAILNLIEQLGIVGTDLVDNVKNTVEQGQKELEEHKEKMDEKLNAIIEEYDGTSI